MTVLGQVEQESGPGPGIAAHPRQWATAQGSSLSTAQKQKGPPIMPYCNACKTFTDHLMADTIRWTLISASKPPSNPPRALPAYDQVRESVLALPKKEQEQLYRWMHDALGCRR